MPALTGDMQTCISQTTEPTAIRHWPRVIDAHNAFVSLMELLDLVAKLICYRSLTNLDQAAEEIVREREVTRNIIMMPIGRDFGSARSPHSFPRHCQPRR